MPLVGDQAAAFTGMRVNLRMDWATPTAAEKLLQTLVLPGVILPSISIIIEKKNAN